MPGASAPRLRVVEMGDVETLRRLAFDYHDLGCLGRPYGEVLRPRMEGTWDL